VVGQRVVVSISVDMSAAVAPDNRLGSYTGTLDWNPAVLAYRSNGGTPAGWMGVVNVTQAASGHLRFTGANASGATGNVVLLTLTFDVVGAGATALDLSYLTMAASATFNNLLPVLTIYDGQVISRMPVAPRGR
jgi:hypothetical protein